VNSNGTRYTTADNLGTPRVVTNSSAGVVSRHDYKPFGEEIGSGIGGRTTGMGYSVADGVRQHFTQKERDAETGLDYFGARYFASTQGRFTSPDPLMASAYVKNPQSWNRYSYALNNPLKYLDPDGMDPEPVFRKYEDLSNDERRILANSTIKIGDQSLSGQNLYDTLKSGTDDQKKELASFLNQTAALEHMVFDNGRTALSYVNSVSEFRVDRVIANVDIGLIDQVRNAKSADGKKRYSGPEDSSDKHGDFDVSFREKHGSNASQQLSFNSKLKFAAADIDVDEECPTCGNPISTFKHVVRVGVHSVSKAKTNPYDIHDRLLKEGIKPHYEIKK